MSADYAIIHNTLLQKDPSNKFEKKLLKAISIDNYVMRNQMRRLHVVL
jgi:hypothetical protein